MEKLIEGQNGALAIGDAVAVTVHSGTVKFFCRGTVDGAINFTPDEAGAYVAIQTLDAEGLVTLTLPTGKIKITAGVGAAAMEVWMQNQ